MTKKPIKDLPQINERIRYPKIRVIDMEGEQLGILTPKEALKMAEEKELDLLLKLELAIIHDSTNWRIGFIADQHEI